MLWVRKYDIEYIVIGLRTVPDLSLLATVKATIRLLVHSMGFVFWIVHRQKSAGTPLSWNVGTVQ